MIDFQQFLLFAFASFMLNITPGNDMIFIASHATNSGARAGVIAALGVAIGCFVHIIAAALGISAIIAQSAFLFDLIKYTGAVYLIYIGIKTMFAKTQSFDIETKNGSTSEKAIFKQGILTNALNPKVALFFLAFLPQFTTASISNVWLQTLILGVWFDISGTIVNILVAIAFGRAGNFLKQYPTFTYWQNKIMGFVLISMGLKVAFMRNK